MRLARQGCDFPGFIPRNWPILLRQLHHPYERERTGNSGTGGDRICMEVKRAVSLAMVNPSHREVQAGQSGLYCSLFSLLLRSVLSALNNKDGEETC